ncbi:hypothetical protein, partial [Ramlibacter sp.]|uniref:hypothetical protein n=1 Tax=Ramlibacter sp. TaxID=1917967 RepID=UPI0017F39687
MSTVDGSGAVPLCWWTPAQLAAMAARLHGPWAHWLADWMPDGGASLARVQCALAWQEPERQPMAWTGAGTRGAAQAWLGGTADGAPQCLDLLFGKSQGGGQGLHAHSMARGIAPQA